MGFFDDDTFDEIIREFFGSSPVRRERKSQFIRSEPEDRVIDFIEDDKKVYILFELPGFSEKDVSVKLKGKELTISVKKQDLEGIPEYLQKKLGQGVFIKKNLPGIVDVGSMHHYFNNGVLEIIFDKKKGGKNVSGKIKIN